MQNKKSIIFRSLFIIAIIILIDQGLKTFILNKYIYLIFANSGSLLGISFGNQGLIIFSIFAFVFFILFVTKQYDFFDKYLNIGFSLILGGGISNLFDRIFRGYVVDYISLKTSAFNFADVLIIIGAVLMLIRILGYKSTINKSSK